MYRIIKRIFVNQLKVYVRRFITYNYENFEFISVFYN